ncbi:MAG: PAS domain-containing protein [Candidatus Thiodiazotropha sp. (ex. Lucinisca nassula)]|nr:PAS domain-containing protein [Candidatus Thiodiazotropha sp. (ex. Lucinisca nassula)]
MNDIDSKSEPAAKKFSGFVVGIGASAGGLEALERFFTHCPSDTGAAFVVVQHLSPDHKSMMIDLLGRYTSMKVVMVKHDMQLEANKVFLIPAGKLMRLEKDRLKLEPKEAHVLTLPIDIFFTSLSEAFSSRAIGVVLSGTGSDGSRGAIAINAAGGFLMAQEANSAKFDGMPASIIGTGLVDAIMRAEDLPKRLLSHITNMPPGPLLPEPAEEEVSISDDDAYEGIMQVLLLTVGIDFHDYKLATILRRIERRMQVRHLNKIDRYYNLLKEERQEVFTLKRELLIPVTNFFRDPETFKVLENNIIDRIVDKTSTGSSIRVWISGVSTGEEAYSVAMLFLEAFERFRRWPNLKIFATDVSQESIDTAAAGVYSEATGTEITTERLERFFSQVGNSYNVKPELRQTIVFAKHNLLSDPPFTQMDLVSCRNTLIYFTHEGQNKALQRLQFAIKPEGYMLLGSSESIASADIGLLAIDTKHKLYQKSANPPPMRFDALGEPFKRYVARSNKKDTVSRTGNISDSGIIDTAVKGLVKEYVPPTMLVNSQNEVVHLFGDLTPYMQAKEGVASLELNRLLPEQVVPVASALIFKAAKDKEKIASDAIRITTVGKEKTVRILVTPLVRDGLETLLLLSFIDKPQSDRTEGKAKSIDIDAETVERIEVLESELAATRESLQATIEELETSNEELQATNEELMASNEELQSSNEELQSVNEELNTVNAEYQEKVQILNRVNADLDSMTKAVGVPTVFVDQHLNLTRYSPDAVGIFKIRETDVGRPLDEITNILIYSGLMEDFKRTMATGRLIQKEVITSNRSTYMVRLLPYHISNDGQGAVATFIDVTAYRDRERLQSIIDALPEHIAVLSHDGTIMLVNKAWIRFAKANGDSDLQATGVGVNYLETCYGPDSPAGSDARKVYVGVKQVLEGNKESFSFEYPCHSPTEKRWFVMNVAPVSAEDYGCVVSHVNISTWYEE